MRISIIISLVAIMLASCNEGTDKSKQKSEKLDEIMNTLASGNQRKAKVLEATDAGTYTYVKLDDNGKIFWAAITARPIEVGQLYSYVEGMMVKDFESKQLGTTFDSVMFIQDFGNENGGHKDNLAKSVPHDHTKTSVQAGLKVEPAKNGITIAGIFSNKKMLEGTKVVVRGQVVKISQNIMKRHWIHIQDGTESEGSYDLTITSTLPVDFAVGDIVTFTGTLSVDKDFGSGYQYDAILEDATWQFNTSL